MVEAQVELLMKPQTQEFNIPGFDAYQLVSEQQPDRAREAREQQEREAAKAALEKRQIQLL